MHLSERKEIKSQKNLEYFSLMPLTSNQSGLQKRSATKMYRNFPHGMNSLPHSCLQKIKALSKIHLTTSLTTVKTDRENLSC